MGRPIKHLDLYYDSYVKHWHRAVFGERAFAFDIDLMGVCSRCIEPLYLIEATRSDQKSTTFLRKLARRADLPAILVRHNEDDILGSSFVFEGGSKKIGDEEALKDVLDELRLKHVCDER